VEVARSDILSKNAPPLTTPVCPAALNEECRKEMRYAAQENAHDKKKLKAVPCALPAAPACQIPT
ncbi:MAG: hypothetical protein ACJ8G3_22725, partial [Burkholderiaceae bacterium]